MPFENIRKFRQNKTILPTFAFEGHFLEAGDDKPFIAITPYHIRSVSYEQHTFKQEGQYHGPGILKTFPVLDRGEAGAYKLTVVFEEDREGTIINFIEYLKSKIINEEGIYNSIKSIKNLSFQLEIHSTPSRTLWFREMYFLTAETNDSSYDNSDMKIYTVNFAYDNYEIYQGVHPKIA
jgi:hypothetical protein